MCETSTRLDSIVIFQIWLRWWPRSCWAPHLPTKRARWSPAPSLIYPLRFLAPCQRTPPTRGFWITLWGGSKSEGVSWNCFTTTTWRNRVSELLVKDINLKSIDEKDVWINPFRSSFILNISFRFWLNIFLWLFQIAMRMIEGRPWVSTILFLHWFSSSWASCCLGSFLLRKSSSNL